MDDNCGECVESMGVARGVVSRRLVWLVGVVESMGVVSGCGFKEIYIYYLSLLLLHASTLFGNIVPTFCSLCKNIIISHSDL